MLAKETRRIARTATPAHQFIVQTLGGIFFPSNSHAGNYNTESSRRAAGRGWTKPAPTLMMIAHQN